MFLHIGEIYFFEFKIPILWKDPSPNPASIHIQRAFPLCHRAGKMWISQENAAANRAREKHSRKSGCHSWLLSVALRIQLITSSFGLLSPTYLSGLLLIGLQCSFGISSFKIPSGDTKVWQNLRTTGLQINQNLWGLGTGIDILLALPR